MANRFVRASSFRHVHGEPAKPDHEFNEVRPQCTGEGNYITANGKFFAYSGIGGGGPVIVQPLNKPGRMAHNAPALCVHKDAVLDFEFNPFVSTLIATGGEDCHIKVSAIPEEGLKSNLNESVAALEGHERKINVLHWHPTASNILASASADLSLKVWDVEKQSVVHTSTDFGDVVQSFDWNPDGSQLLTSCKDLFFRVYDPRNPTHAALKGAGFTGTKSSRALWRGDKNQVIAVGSSKQSQRQYGLWDVRNFDKPLTLVDIDTAAGVLMPMFDADNQILYVAGKGDGNIRYFEVVDTEPYVHFLSEYRDTQSQKGICWLPKRACETQKCEIAVALRLMKDKVIPISFQVPRKSADTFQKDLYPDAYAGVPALTADEWLAGQNKPAPKRSMNPKDSGAVSAAAASAAPVVFKAQKSPAELQRELDTANSRIKELEELVAKLQAGK